MLEGRCLSYGSTIPYLPIIDIVRNSFGVLDTDSPDVITQKVHAGLGALGMELESTAPYLLHLLGCKAGAITFPAANPRHEHEWRVFEEVKPPEGAVLIPGVVGHCCDFIEHPETVAQRLIGEDWTRQPALAAHHKVQRLNDHALAAAPGHLVQILGRHGGQPVVQGRRPADAGSF